MGSLWGKSCGGENEVFYQTSSLRAVSNSGKNVSFQCLFLSPRNTEKFRKASVLCVFTSHNQIWSAQAAKWIQISLLKIHKSTQSIQWKKTKADKMLQLLSTAFYVNIYTVQFSSHHLWVKQRGVKDCCAHTFTETGLWWGWGWGKVESMFV